MSTYSLDTNALIWWLDGSPRLPTHVVRTLLGASQVLVSVAAIWEIELKRGKGKLRIAPTLDIATALDQEGFQAVPVRLIDAVTGGSLPRLHGDPFDRIIVAQAINDRATLVTGDHQLAAYDVDTILI